MTSYREIENGYLEEGINNKFGDKIYLFRFLAETNSNRVFVSQSDNKMSYKIGI